MAFNAGDIEATLTLSRNPFTAGLTAARAQAKKLENEKFGVTLTPRLDQTALARIRTTLNRTVGNVTIRPRLDRAAFERIRATIDRTVGRVTIRPTLDREAFNRIRATIDSNLRDARVVIKTEFDTANLAILEARLNILRTQRNKVELDVDIRAGQLLAVEEKLTQLTLKTREIEIGVDIKAVQLRLVEERLAQLAARSAEIPIDFDIKTAKLLQLEEQILQLELRRPTIQIDIDTQAGKLLLLEEQLLQLELRRPEIEIDFNIKTARLALLEAQLLRLQTTETNHAVNITGNGSSRMKLILAAVTAFLPAIGSAIVGVSGLILGLVSAIGTAAIALGAFGAVGISVFSKINNYAKDNATAVKASEMAANALTSAQNNLSSAVESARQTQANSARQVADAERALADAVENAANSQIQSARRIESTERAVVNSKRALTTAQENLTRAIADTREEMEDLELSLRGGALAEEQAILSLAEAQERLAAARAEGISGNDLKQLELDVKRAALGIDEARERYGDLREESDAFAKSGVEGSQRVRDANQGVSDATQGVRDSELALAEARTQGARDAMAAQRSISDAERDLQEVRIDAAQATIDAQRDIAEAQRAVAMAQKEFAAAQLEQIAALSPALARAEQALQSLKKSYEDLVKRTEDPVANAFTANFKAVETLLKTLDPIVIAVAGAFERIGMQIDKYFSSEHWQEFVGFIAGNASSTIQQFFDIFAFGTRAVMSIITAFDPLADRILPAIATGLREFSGWLDTVSKTPEFNDFIELAAKSLEAFWTWLVAVVKFVWDLSIALAPLGNMMFDFFTGIFNGLSKLPPSLLAGVALGILAIMTALLLGAGGPIALAIGTIAGLAAVMANLYETNENVRKSVDDFVESVKANFGPVFERLGALFEDRIVPAFETVRSTIEDKLAPAFGRFIEAVQPFIAFFTEQVGVVAIDVFERFFKVIDGILTSLSGSFDVITGIITGDWDLFWNGLKTVGEGVLNTFLGVFNTSLETIGTDFNTWKGDFQGFWEDHWIIISDVGAEHNKLINDGWKTLLGDISENLGFERPLLEKSWDGLWKAINENSDMTWGKIDLSWLNLWAGLNETRDSEGTKKLMVDMGILWDDISKKANEVWDFLGIDWGAFWDGINKTGNEKQEARQVSWLEWLALTLANAKMMWDQITATISVALDLIGSYLGAATSKFNDAWGKIANIFATPINWVIRTVLNDGIFNAWNTVMGWIGQTGITLPPAKEIPMYTGTGKIQAFADGGPIKGGIPNKDSVPIMTMPGEYVLSKRAVENIGGVNKVEMMHQAARGGRLSGLGSGTADGMARQHLMRAVPIDESVGRAFAYGGVQPHVARAGAEIESLFGKMPGGIGGVGGRPGPSDHPSGHALDFMTLSNTGLGNRVSEHFLGNAERMLMKYIIWQQRINSGSGWRGMEDRGSPTANHMDHPHVSFLRAGQAGNAFSGAGAGAPDPVSWWSLLSGPVTSLLNGLMPGAIPGIGGPIGGAMMQIPRAGIDKAIAAAKDKLLSLFTNPFGIGGDSNGSPDASMAGGSAVDQVRGVANRYGWGTGTQWNDLYALIQKESNWDPKAANKMSSARGLFQKMTSIHGPIEPTAAGQAEWGLPYIRGRYGSPSSAWAFHRRNNYYKNGGWLMPGESGYNETREPEAIFNRPQLNSIQRAIDTDGLGRGGSRDGFSADEIREIVRAVVDELGGDTINVMLPERATVRELANEIGFRKRVSTKGRYCPK